MIVNPEIFALFDIHQFTHKIIHQMEDDFSKKTIRSLVDVGCGPGNVTQILAKKFPRIRMTGIDLAKNAIDYANEHHRENNINYMVLDISEDHLPEDLIRNNDAIISIHCLNNIIDKKGALKILHKMLKDDAKMYLVVFGWCNFDAITNDIIHDPKWEGYLSRHLDEDENVLLEYSPVKPKDEELLKMWRDLCMETGFNIEHDEIHHEDKSLKTKDELIQVVKSWNLFLPEIPNDRREEFLEDFENMFEKDWLNRMDRNENNEIILKRTFISIISSKIST